MMTEVDLGETVHYVDMEEVTGMDEVPPQVEILNPEEVESRSKYVLDLQSYMEEYQKDIHTALQTIGWTKEFITGKCSSKVACPYDSGHIMSPLELEKHKQYCELRKKGYLPEDIPEMLENSDFVYQNAPSVSSIKLDKVEINKVLWNHHLQNQSVYHGLDELPLTPEDEMLKLSPAERLAIHEHVLLKANKEPLYTDRDEFLTASITDIIKSKSEVKPKPLTKWEILAQERDYKRRRQNYRAKNVHITKKSYTEIIKEVLENQMAEMFPSEQSAEPPRTTDSTPATVSKDTSDTASWEHPDERYRTPHSHDRSPRADRKRTSERASDQSPSADQKRTSEVASRRSRHRSPSVNSKDSADEDGDSDSSHHRRKKKRRKEKHRHKHRKRKHRSEERPGPT